MTPQTAAAHQGLRGILCKFRAKSPAAVNPGTERFLPSKFAPKNVQVEIGFLFRFWTIINRGTSPTVREGSLRWVSATQPRALLSHRAGAAVEDVCFFP